MRVLILVAHGSFDGKSNSHRLAHAAQDALTAAGHEARVVDLAKAGFNTAASMDDCIKINESAPRFEYISNCANPENLKPNVLEQQENIKWCTHVIVCAPIWFHTLPSTFFCYYERVFTSNFAFDDEHTLARGFFTDKKVMICATAGGSKIYFSRESHFPLEATLYPVHVGHFYYSGFQIMRSQCFYETWGDLSDEIMEKWKKAVLNIDKRPILPIQPRGHTESDIEVFARLPDYSLDDAINQQ
ncbi:Flavodoxin-like fold family protein [Tritrichomonas foetus]|uniref:Flavodoxin-like fold family protein n=1 Tax=Tritrichomonas foetus TaxID=1144522 RepID=A0A1J4K2B2_9EUKA|nr:Flavodoxin-like fold family protein [Tritrichomonas foetus]|eukprot:OHT05585.1 Flavodoxin-like fold family protein [Tritrichomonas foetus]